jgi:hypothetical protein
LPQPRTPGVWVHTNIVLIRPEGAISNLVSGECGFAATEVPESLASWPVAYPDQTNLVARARAPAKRLLGLGDVYGDGGKSIDFALIYMFALAHSAQMVGEEPDVAIVLRPDVAIAGRLWIRWRVLLLAMKSRAQRLKTHAPAWGSFGRVNNRFAVMSGHLAKRHLGRVENVDTWVTQGRPFDLGRSLPFSWRV